MLDCMDRFGASMEPVDGQNSSGLHYMVAKDLGAYGMLAGLPTTRQVCCCMYVAQEPLLNHHIYSNQTRAWRHTVMGSVSVLLMIYAGK